MPIRMILDAKSDICTFIKLIIKKIQVGIILSHFVCYSHNHSFFLLFFFVKLESPPTLIDPHAESKSRLKGTAALIALSEASIGQGLK